MQSKFTILRVAEWVLGLNNIFSITLFYSTFFPYKSLTLDGGVASAACAAPLPSLTPI